MKKIILLALTYIIPVSCDNASDNSNQRSIQEGNKWIVESKSPPIFMVGYTLKLSNVKSYRLRVLKVGKYTYDKTNIGDTISL